MNTLFEKSFLKDIKKIRDQRVSDNLAKVLEVIKKADDLSMIGDIKKLKGHPSAFRIKIGDFRLGLFFEDDNVILTRFLNRKDIYKFFPK
jgi:mRNA interferase RelE/StbE